MTMFDFFKKKQRERRVWFSTDIHCHVIPGVDDGSPDVETSVSLITAMHEWGINRIIASPHVTYGTFPNTPDTIAEPRENLRAALAAAGVDVELSNSAEYRIDDLLLEHIADGTLMLLPDKHLLIENSFLLEPWNIDQLVFDLLVKGYKPILAHPERYSYYYNRRERYKTLHEAGLALQINLLSLAGAYGKEEKRVAEWLIESGLVDFIGTDIHRMRHIEFIDEYLGTRDADRHERMLADTLRNDTAFV